MRRRASKRWLALASLCALAACAGDDGASSQSLDDEGGCLDDGEPYDPLGKADGANVSKERPFTQIGHLKLGQPVAVPEEALRPGWTFHGLAGAELALSDTGAAVVYLYGPKLPGDAWPLPPAELAATQRALTLPEDGMYALAVQYEDAVPPLVVSCEAGPCVSAAWRGALRSDALSVVAVGDLGLTVSDAPVDWDGGSKYHEYHWYVEMLEGFYPYLDGDVNLANLETAVTAGGTRQEKTYVFRMPPSGLDAALADGFNLLGLANNHAGDYGADGVVDTAAALDDAVAAGALLGWTGAGTGFEAASRPAVLERGGVRIALGACGIGYDVRSFGSGVAHVSDGYEVADRLVAAAADLRILSIHAGVERELSPTAQVQALARYAADRGVDIVHGHHPHVVQGIEARGDALIFYSMGNFELRGARNMASLGPDRDYGIAARLQFDENAKRLVEVEVVPVYDMQRVVYVLPSGPAADRMERLNQRSASLDSGGLMLQIDPSTGHGFAEL